MQKNHLAGAEVQIDPLEERRPAPGDAGPLVLGVALVWFVAFYVLLAAGAVLVSLQHASLDALGLLAGLDAGVYAAGLAVPLVVLLNWLVAGLVLHVAISLGGGDAGYVDTLAVVGWSTPATLLAALVTGLGFLLSLWGNPVPMGYGAKLVSVGPGIAVAAVVAGLLSLVWQGYCWPPGLRRVHDVDGGAAGKATAATVLIGALGLLFSL